MSAPSTETTMSKQEITSRVIGLDLWLRHNNHQPNYNGVLLYRYRLLKLLYKP